MESDIAAPVMAWLRERGFTPYGEIRWYNRAIDVVGLSEDTVEAVELKTSLTKKVIYQAYLNQLASHRSWCAVATRPRKFVDRLTDGLGLLCVIDGRVEVLKEAGEARSCRFTCEHHLKAIRGACAYKTPDGPAGLPTMRGIGIAQDVFNAVQKFIAENPKAKWQQIFDAVPNHYAHARSMQGAMRTIRDVRAYRARKEMEKSA